MKKLLVTVAIVLFASTSRVYAQPGSGYARRAIQDKYEKDNADNKAKGMAWLDNMSSGKTEAQYSFPIALTMHISSYEDGNLKKETDLKYHLNSTKKYFGFSSMENEKKKKKNDEKMFMIYDFNNNSMIMLNEEKKTGMAININAFMSKGAQEKRGQPKASSGSSDYKTKCEKTGKTKTIQGYSCVQYVCIDEDRNRKTEMWVTNKLDIDISQSFSRSPYAYMGDVKGYGFMMEGDFYKNNQLESKMEVTELNQNANLTINMSDYTLSGMR